MHNKKILVTGADGFIGSHLVEQLINEGANVRAFVYYNSFNSWGWLDSLPKEILEKIHDMDNVDELYEFFKLLDKEINS